MSNSAASDPASGPRHRDPAAALDFGDPLGQRSHDDSDGGWGERPGAREGGGAAADLARFLDERPPHHL